MNIITVNFLSPVLTGITILSHVNVKYWTSASLRKESFFYFKKNKNNNDVHFVNKINIWTLDPKNSASCILFFENFVYRAPLQ